MAGILDTVYTLLVLLLALVGVTYVFARSWGQSDEGNWTRWGELVAVAVFLVAMVATLLLAA